MEIPGQLCVEINSATVCSVLRYITTPRSWSCV